MWEAKTLNVCNVCWFDERSVNCGMTRLYGRAFSHEWVVAYVLDGCFEWVLVMGVLGVGGLLCRCFLGVF